MRRQHGQIGAQHAGQLGQFDPSTGIIADVQLGPEDPSSGIQTLDNPDILSTHGYASYGLPSSTPSTPSSPTSSPIFATFGPYGTTDPTAAGTMAPTVGVPSPAPRVNIPTNTASGFLSSSLGGIPMVAILGIGIVAVLALSGGGGRRRR